MSKKNIKRLDQKSAKTTKASSPAKKSGNGLFGYLLGFAVVIVVIAFTSLGGGMLMSIFGFQYESIGSVILFFLASTAISYPLIRLVTQFPRIMCVQGLITKGAAFALYVALGTAANAISFYIFDRLMDNISATFPAILAISALLALPGTKDVDKRPQ